MYPIKAYDVCIVKHIKRQEILDCFKWFFKHNELVYVDINYPVELFMMLLEAVAVRNRLCVFFTSVVYYGDIVIMYNVCYLLTIRVVIVVYKYFVNADTNVII